MKFNDYEVDCNNCGCVLVNEDMPIEYDRENETTFWLCMSCDEQLMDGDIDWKTASR